MKPIIRSILLVAAVLLSTGAQAQWQWLDKDGRMVFSDRAPPPGVPDKQIVKRPGGSRAGVPPVNVDADPAGQPAAPTSAASGTQSAASAPKASGVDKDLADKKKKVEQEEAAKRKAEEDKLAKVKADNCSRARDAKASYASGMRLARVNKQGEREIVDDVARAAELQRVQTVIDADCQ